MAAERRGSRLAAMAARFDALSLRERAMALAVLLALGFSPTGFWGLRHLVAREGYPLIDQLDEGPCCEDESDPVFHCAWKVEQIELPDPPMTSGEDSTF